MALTARNLDEARKVANQISSVVPNNGLAGRVNSFLRSYDEELALINSLPEDDTSGRRAAALNNLARFEANALESAQRLTTSWNEQISNEKRKLQNEAANIANMRDVSGLPADEANRVLAATQARYDDFLNKANRFEQSYGALGENLADLRLSRDQSGNFVADTAGNQARTVGKSGEPLGIRQTAEGYQIYGSRSGNTYGVFASEADALAEQTRIQSGSTPGRTLPGSTISSGGSFTSGGGSSTEDYFSALETAVDSQAAAAEAQGFTVTPEMRALYLAQAQEELKPYYGETIKLLELDIGTSLDRAIEDFQSAEANTVTNYRKNLESSQENLRDSGMLYGGVRDKTERELADTYNTSLDATGRSFERSLEDISTSAEKSLGTTGAQSLLGSRQTRSVGRVLAGSPTFSYGEEKDIFKPIGDVYGEIPRDQTYSTETRANELESAERDRFSQFV